MQKTPLAGTSSTAPSSGEFQSPESLSYFEEEFEGESKEEIKEDSEKEPLPLSDYYVWAQDEGTPYFSDMATQFIEIHEQKYNNKVGKSALPNRNLTIIEFDLIDLQDETQNEKHLILVISGRTVFPTSLTKEDREKFKPIQRENKIFLDETMPAFFKEMKLPTGVLNVHVLLNYNKATETFFKMNRIPYWACSEPKAATELGRWALLAQACGKNLMIRGSENYTFNSKPDDKKPETELLLVESSPSSQSLSGLPIKGRAYIRVWGRSEEGENKLFYVNKKTNKCVPLRRIQLNDFDSAMGLNDRSKYDKPRILSSQETQKIESITNFKVKSGFVKITRFKNRISTHPACEEQCQQGNRFQQMRGASIKPNPGLEMYYRSAGISSKKSSVLDFQCRSYQPQAIGPYLFTRTDVPYNRAGFMSVYDCSLQMKQQDPSETERKKINPKTIFIIKKEGQYEIGFFNTESGEYEQQPFEEEEKEKGLIELLNPVKEEGVIKDRAIRSRIFKFCQSFGTQVPRKYVPRTTALPPSKPPISPPPAVTHSSTLASLPLSPSPQPPLSSDEGKSQNWDFTTGNQGTFLPPYRRTSMGSVPFPISTTPSGRPSRLSSSGKEVSERDPSKMTFGKIKIPGDSKKVLPKIPGSGLSNAKKIEILQNKIELQTQSILDLTKEISRLELTVQSYPNDPRYQQRLSGMITDLQKRN